MERDVTFTYACLSDEGIVLAADSQVTFEQHNISRKVVGTYLGERSKIVRIGKHSAFSMSGSGGYADALVQAGEACPATKNARSFDEAIQAYRELFREEQAKREFNGPYYLVSFLFCGYSDVQGTKTPKRVILSSSNNFNYHDVARYQPAWTGAVEHGAALYLHHRFHPKERLLSLENAKLLAYCIVKEVAEQDNYVGGTIEMEVITESGSAPFRDVEKYERERQRLAAEIRAFIESYKD